MSIATATTTSIFPWITDKNQFSSILTSSELVFSDHNNTPRQRYIGWRLWSLQKPTVIPNEPKFYFQDTYSEDEYSDDEYISNSIPIQILPEGEEEEERTLHHCPSHFNNLNLFMLN